MALMQCPKCGRKISGMASVCPFCDYTLRQATQKTTESNYYNEEIDADPYVSRKASSRTEDEGKRLYRDALPKSRDESYQPHYKSSQTTAKSSTTATSRSASAQKSRSNDASASRSSDVVEGSARAYKTQANNARTFTRFKMPADVSDFWDDGETEETVPTTLEEAEEEIESTSEEVRKPKSAPVRKKGFRAPSGSAGHKLLGFRQGVIWHMFLMLLFDMSATVLVFYGIKLMPTYMEKSLTVLHTCRILLGALLAAMPTILLSDTDLRRSLPFLSSKEYVKQFIGCFIGCLPVLVLFVLVCMKFK